MVVTYPQTVPFLIEMSKDVSGDVRRAVVDTLVDTGDTAAIPAVETMLEDGDLSVRRSTIDALERLRE